jgi:oligopeptide transport system ATP-binding protein
MYLGHIVEIADSDTLFNDPQHPYTRALLAAVPVPDPEIERPRPQQVIEGEIPSPMHPPSGCVFHPRCPIADADCRRNIPDLRDLGGAHFVACPKVGHPMATPAWAARPNRSATNPTNQGGLSQGG